jgi:co-chaperonin GroES (HSP10)
MSIRLALPRQTIEKFSKIDDLEEYKKAVWDQVRPDEIDVYLNRVLCAVYFTAEKTKGGIIRPVDNLAEDIWQGKICLVLKVGPTAFQDSNDIQFGGMSVEPGDWISFRINHGAQVEYNHYPCRIVSDHFIETRLKDPRILTS